VLSRADSGKCETCSFNCVFCNQRGMAEQVIWNERRKVVRKIAVFRTRIRMHLVLSGV
jgi:wyosine [tRNA(Phe)-imidazoG37] synthetase (radical SAM superfamily)